MNNLTEILKLAIPLVIIQLCQASLGLVDTLVAGQYHSADLAGVGLGSSLWTPVFIFATGVMYVLVPRFSAAVSAGDRQGAAVLFRQGRHVALMLGVVSFVLIQGLAFACPWLLEQGPVGQIAKHYLHCVAFAAPGLAYMLLYRFTVEGHSILTPIILTALFLLVCHAVLAVVLVNGLLFVAPMGGAGAGLATAISAYLALFFLRALVHRACPELVAKRCEQNDPPRLGLRDSMTLFKEGLPIGLALVLQILALSVLAFFAFSLGTDVVSAHQVVITIAMVVVMIPLALGSATTIRIAAFHALGDQQNKRSVALWAFAVAGIYAALAGAALLWSGPTLTGYFSNDIQVIRLASGLIACLAAFQFFDAVQMVASGVLRGLGDFIKPFAVVVFAYWIIVIPAGYVVGVRYAQDIGMVWTVLALAIFVAAGVLCRYVYKALSGRGETVDVAQGVVSASAQ